MTWGDKWSAKHELQLSGEWRNVLPSWWLWENDSCWTNHHKVSPVLWMYTNWYSYTPTFPLKPIPVLLSVLKLVGDLSIDVRSRVVKDFSMATHRNRTVRVVLLPTRAKWIYSGVHLSPSVLALVQPTQQVTVTSSGRTVKRRFHQLDDDPDQEVLILICSFRVLMLFGPATQEQLRIISSLFMRACHLSLSGH